MKRALLVLLAITFTGCSAQEACVDFTDGYSDTMERGR